MTDTHFRSYNNTLHFTIRLLFSLISSGISATNVAFISK
uniref:Uncharacterized protein n=1 Tax=virus sp. ctQ5V6 TaxID=2825815 RepID=A0A8S5RQF1_9VIRU|nr:MAG TPA: hypothetical protein [virus sp. ctQ5V6]